MVFVCVHSQYHHIIFICPNNERIDSDVALSIIHNSKYHFIICLTVCPKIPKNPLILWWIPFHLIRVLCLVWVFGNKACILSIFRSLSQTLFRFMWFVQIDMDFWGLIFSPDCSIHKIPNKSNKFAYIIKDSITFKIASILVIVSFWKSSKKNINKNRNFSVLHFMHWIHPHGKLTFSFGIRIPTQANIEWFTKMRLMARGAKEPKRATWMVCMNECLWNLKWKLNSMFYVLMHSLSTISLSFFFFAEKWW